MQKTAGNNLVSMRSLGRRPPRRKIQPRFFVFLSALILLLVLVSLPFLPRSTASVRLGSVGNSTSTQALVVHDETVQSVKAFGQLQPLAMEGRYVTAGDPVIEVFTSSYNDTEKQKLQDVQMQIKALQESSLLQDVNDQSLRQLDSRIADQLKQITAIARGDTQIGLYKAENDLGYLISDRHEFLQRDTAANKQLQQLYDQEKNIRARVESLKTVVNAGSSGVVSYYLDGLEPVFTYIALEQVDVSQARTLLKSREVEIQSGAKGERPIFRVVNPEHFALIALLPKDNTYALDQKVPVHIKSANLSCVATVRRVVSDAREQLVVLEVVEEIASFISQRKADISVGGTQEGMIVPIDALYGDGSAVTLTDGTTVDVIVLARDKSNALVEPVTTGELRVGQSVKLEP